MSINHDFCEVSHSGGFILHFGKRRELEKYDSGFVCKFVCDDFAGFVPQEFLDDVLLDFGGESDITDDAFACVARCGPFAGLAISHDAVA